MGVIRSMPPEQPSIAPSSGILRHLRVRGSFLFALLALVALVGGYVAVQLWLAQNYAAETPIATEMETERPPEELSGKIYMSLAPAYGDHSSLDIYSYDTKWDFFSQETDEENREFYTSKISPDGTKMAVASLLNASENASGTAELFIRTIVNGDNEEVRTLEPLIEKRNPTWSADGAYVAFVARASAEADFYLPETWSVYVYKIGSDANAKLLTEGANPIFLPDGNLAVLKHDGIYYVNRTSGEATRTPLVEGESWINTKFDISRDGTKVALALPINKEVFVVPIASWAPFRFGGESTLIPTPAFWPVFSPGGDYLAMQVFEWNEEWTPTTTPIATEQRLMVYSLRDNTWGPTLDLREYAQNKLFITDWATSE